MLITFLAKQNNKTINIQQVNIKTKLALKKLVKKKVEKVVITTKKAEFVVIKKLDIITIKLKKIVAAKKRVIEKKSFKYKSKYEKS